MTNAKTSQRADVAARDGTLPRVPVTAWIVRFVPTAPSQPRDRGPSNSVFDSDGLGYFAVSRCNGAHK